MFINIRRFGLFAVGAALSGCAFINSDTSVSPVGALQSDLISRSGSSEGPSDTLGNSFTTVLNWARIGGGTPGLDSSAITLRHAPAVVSPNGISTAGLKVFSPTDSYSVEGGRSNTSFSFEGFTSNSILGRFTETEGSGSSFRGYAAFATAGFKTPYADIVKLGRAGGTVRYQGNAVAEVFDPFARSDSATGTATVDVNYGANNITGSMVFQDPVGTGVGPDLGDFTLDLTSGSIVGNTFTASVAADPADFGADTMNPINLTGSLYGANGSDIGGSFATTGTATGSGEGLVVIGGFLATN